MDNINNNYEGNFKSDMNSNYNFDYSKSIFGIEEYEPKYDFDDLYYGNHSDLFEEINELESKLRFKQGSIDDLMNKLDRKEVKLEKLIRKNLPTIDDEILDYLDIKRDNSGNIVLYHATPSIYLDEILSGGLKPPKETGNNVWRMKYEEDKLKLSKVYLSSENRINEIANHIQSFSDGLEISLIEAKVEEYKLYPDEDSSKYSWIASMNELETCAHLGKIEPSRLSLIGKLDSYEIDEENKFNFNY